MAQNKADLLYKDGDYDIIHFGDYVICAVTQSKIALDDLAYWSVERQEAYANCAAALKRKLDLDKRG